MTEIMPDQYAPNGNHAPNGPADPGQRPGNPDLRPGRLPTDRTVDALSDAYGPCIPWGPEGQMITPSEASAMLVMLYERQQHLSAAYLWEAKTGEAIPSAPRQRNR